MKKYFRIVLVLCSLVLFIGYSWISFAAESKKGGAQLWGENCARCHNMRSPSERSDKEWDTIAFHMRVRANLTTEEHKAILEFLKSAN